MLSSLQNLCYQFLGTTLIPKLSRKTSKWRFRLNDELNLWKRQVWPNTFFVVDILHRYHWKQNNCKRPTYYTAITLFDQNRKHYNQNTKILHIVSHIVLQAALLIITTGPSNYVTHAQLLTVGNFEIKFETKFSALYAL